MEPETHQMTASAFAVRSMLPSSEERRKQIQDLFDRRQREKAAIKKAKQAIKLQEQKAVLQDRFEIDPVVIQMIMKMYALPEARRAKVYFQYVTLCNDAGFDVDMPIADEAEEEEEENGAVFDQTKTARRQGGKHFGPPIQRRARRDSDRVTRTRVNSKLAQEMLDRLRMGLPARYRPGRPTNEEKLAREWAEARFAEGATQIRGEGESGRPAEAQAEQAEADQGSRGGNKAGGQGP